MEKKEVLKRSNSFRTLFDSKFLVKSIFGRFFDSKNSRIFGFTLIELIVAVGIVSTLAMVSLVAINPAEQFKKANDARRKSDLAQIQRALESYYEDNGSYPGYSSVTEPKYRIIRLDLTTADWGTQWIPYMNLLPKDPIASKNYAYYSAGQSYFLYASLDRGSKDPQACNSGNACVRLPAGASCGSGICNFGVSSPNVTP